MFKRISYSCIKNLKSSFNARILIWTPSYSILRKWLIKEFKTAIGKAINIKVILWCYNKLFIAIIKTTVNITMNCHHLVIVPSGSGVRNPPAMQETQETWIQSLGVEDPLEEGMATHSSSCLGNPMDRGAWRSTVHRVAQSCTQWSNSACIDIIKNN